MRVIVIGGTGHVGTYLVPRLVEAGHDVVVISRGQREPYQSHGAWAFVERVTIDRTIEEKAGRFGERVAGLGPDIVVDMTSFVLESASQLVDALRGKVKHFLHCGTIWVHGPSVIVPVTEQQARRPMEDYGIRKEQIEAYLLAEAHLRGFPATVIHPGHIVGPGWVTINPAGHTNLEVFNVLASGKELALPNLGMETLHHVHADDVAQVFERAMANWSTAVGHSFHAVSPSALTLRGFAEATAGWFGKVAKLKFLPWEQWKQTCSEDEARITYSNISHSPNCSIEKARRLIGYEPRYTSLQAVHEAVQWLIERGRIQI